MPESIVFEASSRMPVGQHAYKKTSRIRPEVSYILNDSNAAELSVRYRTVSRADFEVDLLKRANEADLRVRQEADHDDEQLPPVVPPINRVRADSEGTVEPVLEHQRDPRFWAISLGE